MEPLIQVENIHKIYNPGENEVRALDGVSLTIHRGELVAIIGTFWFREIDADEHARLSGYTDFRALSAEWTGRFRFVRQPAF